MPIKVAEVDALTTEFPCAFLLYRDSTLGQPCFPPSQLERRNRKREMKLAISIVRSWDRAVSLTSNVTNASVDYSSFINAPHEYFDDTRTTGLRGVHSPVGLLIRITSLFRSRAAIAREGNFDDRQL
jgi:hypothetical protein